AQLTTFDIGWREAAAGDLSDDVFDALSGERLGDHPIHLCVLLFIRAGGFTPSGNDRQWYPAITLANRACQIPTSHPGHPYVGEHCIERLRFKQLQRFETVFCFGDLMP